MSAKHVCAVALLIFAGATCRAEEFPGGARFDGRIKIVELKTPECGVLSDTAGDRHKAIFRAISPTSSLPEGMQISVKRGVLYVQAEFDRTFAGKRQVVTGAYTIDAYRTALPDSLFSLEFHPHKITDTTDSFNFEGTWKNYRVFNCVAVIRGQFTRRPPE